MKPGRHSPFINQDGFRHLFDDATIGILVASSGGRIELVNSFMEKLFGYSNEELIGQPIEILIPYCDRSGHKSLRDCFFENPGDRPMGQGISLYGLRKDGKEFPVDIWLGHYPVADEIFAVAYVTDISVRKAHEEKYSDLFENPLAAMFITDLTTSTMIEVNQTAVLLFGYSSKSDFLKNFDPSDHFVFPDGRQRTYRDSIGSIGNSLTREQEMKKLDGTHFWAQMFVKLNQDNTIAQTMAVDITERKLSHKRLETAVQRRTIELTELLAIEKELNETKSRFVTIASHEFRAPLGIILLSLSLIELYNKENEEQKRRNQIELLRAKVKNLVVILDDFLSLEKLEQGREKLVMEPFDLHHDLEEMVEESKVMLKRGQRISFIFDGEDWIIQDKKKLKHVVLNLLSNAIKYSEDNKEIHISALVHNHSVLIRVQDEGIGIPQEDQVNLFSKFFRAKNAGYVQGTGFGLYLVKKYVELMKGTIGLKSEPGKGTVFTIEWPQNNELSGDPEFITAYP